jgi:hypothetical protein
MAFNARTSPPSGAQRAALRLLALLFLALLALPAQQAAAQAGQRCFPETGQCISGPIRMYWERNGGLPVFGYPITALQNESVEGTWTGPVQWFERDRLEDHSAEGIGVLAGRLGARFLEVTNSPWEAFPKVGGPGGGCQFFPQTGHSLCEPYLSYWRGNGGLERFGYPVTQPIYETLEGRKYAVQYFERRRMEVHPELPGSPVLLGLLGRGVRDNPEPLMRYPECLQNALPSLRDVNIGKPLGCPTLAPLAGVPASTQQFQRGIMLWTDTRNRPRLAPNVPAIFALINPGPTMQSFDDTWAPGEPDTPAATPPSAGLYAPWRGFGKTWAANPGLQAAIGWATEAQAEGRTADIELFDKVLLVRINETGVVYAFGNTNTPTDAQIVSP